jgi:hypothetical protein
MALVLPLVAVLTASLIDLGAIAYSHMALENGVSQATRFAVTGRKTGKLTRRDSIVDAIRTATPAFQVLDGDVSFYNVSKGSTDPGGPDDLIMVSVAHTWNLLSPVLRPMFPGGKYKVRVSSTMKNEPFPNS